MQLYVKRYGIAKLSIDDEEMMPLLIAMREVGKEHGTGVHAFDWSAPGEQAEKVFLGLYGPTLQVSQMVSNVTALVADRVPACKRKITVTQKHGVAVAYNPHLTLSAAAMGPKQ